ncbi:MAG TPA: NTP transferase domain-containing protein [Nitrospirota bacterium]|nr:NTP transferase domain-containing protein [Nitrospirota bacterium]
MPAPQLFHGRRERFIPSERNTGGVLLGTDKNISAIVLAAGFSTRAPGFKPLLPLGRGTVIEATIGNLCRGGIDDIVVVIGNRAEEMRRELALLDVRAVYNRSFEKGMFSSIVAGVNALSPRTEAFFLMPVDLPLVRCHTIRTLRRTFRRRPAKVIYPVFRGERGHPPLISAACCPAIRSWSQPEGLRSLLALFEAESCEVETADEGILLDIDTREDYEAIAKRFRRRDIPTSRECGAILSLVKAPATAERHGNKVAAVARTLAERLNEAGMKLDIGLVAAAGLLHDLAKGRPRHERTGARMLDAMGYCDVAAIVAVHRDIEFDEGRPLNEAAVVHLADKLVKGEEVVTIDERFQGALEKFTRNGEPIPEVRQRLVNARAIADAVERVLGMDLEHVLAKHAKFSVTPVSGSEKAM